MCVCAYVYVCVCARVCVCVRERESMCVCALGSKVGALKISIGIIINKRIHLKKSVGQKEGLASLNPDSKRRDHSSKHDVFSLNQLRKHPLLLLLQSSPTEHFGFHPVCLYAIVN